MSEVHFLGGGRSEVRDEIRIVFEVGQGPEPTLYADAADATCLGGGGNPLTARDLVGRTVADVSTDAGVLQIAFTDGATLRCGPDPDYEAWQVVGGTPQGLVVCLPGGELAVWSD